jgi:TP901 family phage tail tape measure protein
MGRTGNAAAVAGAKVSWLGKASLVAATGVLAFAAYGVKSYTDFNKAMTESTAIMEGETTAQVKAMERAAKSVATQTKFSAAEAAEGFYFMASAGLNAAQSIKALPLAAKFAQAGVVDLETGVEYLTDTMSIFDLKTKNSSQNLKNMTRVADVFTEATIASQGTLSQFAEAMSTAQSATDFGLKSIEEVTAALAVFHDNGVKGAKAGMQLQMAVRDLTGKALKNKKAWEDQNIAVFDSKGNMRDLADIIKDLEDAFKGKSDAQKRAILQELGLQDRAVKSILLLEGNSKALRQYNKDLKEAGGRTEKVADKQMNSLENQLKKLKNTVQVASIAFGVALVPAIKVTVAVIGALTRAFISLPEWLQNTIAFVLVFASVLRILQVVLVATKVHLMLGGALHAFNWLVFAATGKVITFTGVLGGLKVALYAVGTAGKAAATGLLAMAAAHPVVWGIAAGLAVVVATLYLLGKGDVVAGAKRVVRWFKSIIFQIQRAIHYTKGYVHLMRGQFKKAAEEFAKGRNMQKKADKEYYGKHYKEMEKKSKKHRKTQLTGWRAHFASLAAMTNPFLLLLENLHIRSNKRTESGQKKSMNRRLKEGRKFSFDMVRWLTPGWNLLIAREKYYEVKRLLNQKKNQKKRKNSAKKNTGLLAQIAKRGAYQQNRWSIFGAKKAAAAEKKGQKKRQAQARSHKAKQLVTYRALRNAAVAIVRKMGMSITSIYNRITRYARNSSNRLRSNTQNNARNTARTTTSIFSRMGASVSSLFNRMRGSIANATRGWFTATSASVGKIKANVSSGFNWVYQTVARVVNAIVRILNKFLPGKGLKLKKVPGSLGGGGGGGGKKGRGQKDQGGMGDGTEDRDLYDKKHESYWSETYSDDRAEAQGMETYYQSGDTSAMKYPEAHWPTSKKAPKGGFWWYDPAQRGRNVRRFGDVPGVPESTFKGEGKYTRYLADRDMGIEMLDRQTKGQGEKAYAQIYKRVIRLQSQGVHPMDIDRELMQGGSLTVGGKSFDISPGTMSYLNLGNLYRRYSQFLYRSQQEGKEKFYSGPGDYRAYGFISGGKEADIFGPGMDDQGGASSIAGLKGPKGNTLYHKVARAAIDVAKKRAIAEFQPKKPKKDKSGGGWGSTEQKWGQEYKKLQPDVRKWAKYLGSMFGAELVSGHRGAAKGLHAKGKAFDLKAAPRAMEDMVRWVRKNVKGVSELAYGSGKHKGHVHIGFAEKGMYAKEDMATVVHKEEMVLPADITAGLLGLIKGKGGEKRGGKDFAKTLGTKKLDAEIKDMVKGLLGRLLTLQKKSGERFRITRKTAVKETSKERKQVVKDHDSMRKGVQNQLTRIENRTRQSWGRTLNTTRNTLQRMLTVTRTMTGDMHHAVYTRFNSMAYRVSEFGKRIRTKLHSDWSGAYGIVARTAKKMVDVVNQLMPDNQLKADIPDEYDPGGVGDASGFETASGMGLAGAPGTGDAGMASWYGPGFYGNRTASGAIYSPTHWGVAHKSLPFGTMLEIGYGGKTVRAPVTDRGPYVGNRVLDLSNAVAQALGFGGVAMVNYRRVDGGAMGMTGVPGAAGPLSLDDVKYKVNQKTLHGKLAGSLLERLRGELKKVLAGPAMAPAFDGSVTPGGPIAGLLPHVGKWVSMLINKFGIRMSSGLRPGARTARGTVSLHASGRAADLVGSGAALDAAAALARTLPGIDEVIWRAPGHYDHLHVGFAKLGGYSERTQAAVVHPNEWVLPERKLQKQIKEAMLEVQGGGKQVTQHVNVYPQKVEPDAETIAKKLAWKLKTEGI